MSKPLIVIDPGHGPGNKNQGPSGYFEHKGMWVLSNYLKDKLTARGFEVKLTRKENEDPSLTARGKLAAGAVLFISEHSNASNQVAGPSSAGDLTARPGGKAKGVEVYYSVDLPGDKVLAASLSKSVSDFMGNPDRGAKTRPSTKDSGEDYYTVIDAAQDTGCPFVFLIENGFHDNAQDEEILKSETALKAIAKIQAEVICKAMANVAEASQSKLNEVCLSALVSLGVINTPDYWRKVNVQYLNDLLEKAAASGLLDKRIDNGIADLETAFTVLSDAGIVNTPDYWRTVAGSVWYVKELLINMANRARIVLEKIIHAEACGEPLDGQVLAGNVIMNRCSHKSFPDGIYNVVFQPNQFSPVADGAYAKAVPSASVKKAVDIVLSETDKSQGALYFRTIKGASPDCWHETALARLLDVGGHRFYK